MSIPLTRRIARAALLVAAGAAPVVGAAGSASAAVLPATSNLAGLSTLDATHAAGVVDHASQQVTRTAGAASGTTVQNAVPTVGTAVGRGTGAATPAAAQQVAGAAGAAAGGAAAAAAHGLPAA